jgi:hypothetical protein
MNIIELWDSGGKCLGQYTFNKTPAAGDILETPGDIDAEIYNRTRNEAGKKDDNYWEIRLNYGYRIISVGECGSPSLINNKTYDLFNVVGIKIWPI